MSFTHKHKDMVDHQHDTVAEARECEDELAMQMMEPPSCPVCDAWGCWTASGGCKQYEQGSAQYQYEVEQERIAEAMMFNAQFPLAG